VGRRTARVEQGLPVARELPVVPRDHHVAPHLTDEQGREALRVALRLQEFAVTLDPLQAHTQAVARRRTRVVRLAVVAFALEVAAAVAVFGQGLPWWPA
jgi:hypothetical protein